MPITHILAATDGTEQEHFVKKPETLTNNQHIHHNDETHHWSQPILIDTDAGIDDAWALMLMLEAHKNSSNPIKVEAITCVHGNTTVDNVVKNVTRVLKVSNVQDIPVYKGCETAFAIPFKEPGEFPFNGKDGFGDTELPNIASLTIEEHAVNEIVRLAEIHKGNLTILALGPLTNLAMALRMQPKIKHYIKDIFIFGGNMEGQGNATVCGEFNFVADVESAHVVLSNFACPIYLVPWEACIKYGTSSYSWRVNTIGSIQTEQMKLLNTIESKILDEFREGWMTCDAIAAAVLIEPKIAKRKQAYHCVVELHGTHSRGLLIVDRNYKFQKKPNVMIITEIDLPLLQKMLIWGVGGPFYK